MKGANFSLAGIEIREGAFYSSWYLSVSERIQHCWDARGGWGRVEGASPSSPTRWASSQLYNLWLLNDDLVKTWWPWWRTWWRIWWKTRWPWCSSQRCRWTIAKWRRGEGRWRWAKCSGWKIKVALRWPRCPGSMGRFREKLLKSFSRLAQMDCFWQVLHTRVQRKIR